MKDINYVNVERLRDSGANMLVGAIFLLFQQLSAALTWQEDIASTVTMEFIIRKK